MARSRTLLLAAGAAVAVGVAGPVALRADPVVDRTGAAGGAAATAAPSPAAPSPAAPSPLPPLRVAGSPSPAASPSASAPLPRAAAAGSPAPTAGRPAAVGPFRRTARDAYVWAVEPVTAARLGSSHRAGCPVAVSDLRLVTVTHWTFAGRTARGQLVVHRSAATDAVAVFRALHAARFPLTRVVTAERYGADDDRLMAANATSAYNCRTVAGTTRFSEHAYGLALDVNPVQNPYVRGSTVEPPAGRAFLDRGDVRPGMVVRGDAVVRAFASVGWEWGGDFRTSKDYQHFSANGR